MEVLFAIAAVVALLALDGGQASDESTLVIIPLAPAPRRGDLTLLLALAALVFVVVMFG